MFTGLISELGEVVSLRGSGGAALKVKAQSAASESSIGDSIAVNGACLTVTSIESSVMSFDVSEETLSSTTLGSLRPGGRVNIEQSLRAGGRLGGHFVTGHVDGVGRIRAKGPLGQAIRFEIEAPAGITKYLVPKGSVAVDGISLTVVDVMDDAFSIVIIPHTSDITTMGHMKPGDAVNLEADIIGKYVHRFVSLGTETDSPNRDEKLLDALKKGGFTL